MATMTRTPTGDHGSYSQWDALGAGSKYVEVAAVGEPDDDTSYIYTATAYKRQLFTFSAFTVPAGATIESVTVTIRCRGASVSAEARPTILAGSILAATGSKLYTTSYSEKAQAWATNPATSSAWTVDEINGTSGSTLNGFGVQSEDANEIRCTQVTCTVTYTEAAASFARPSSDVAGGTFRSIVTTAPFGPRVIA